MDEITHVHPNVSVFGVELFGPEVLVDVYGGPASIVGSITYRVDDPRRRRTLVSTLRKWRKENTQLAYVEIEDDCGRLVEMDTYTKMRLS